MEDISVESYFSTTQPSWSQECSRPTEGKLGGDHEKAALMARLVALHVAPEGQHISPAVLL